MKKIDYIKKAWNKAADKVDENMNKDYIDFKYVLGIKVGLTIALRIIENTWKEEEIEQYLSKIIDI